ncbi:MAG: hypothetical protein ACXAD7_12390 [Candidatus Kariarchaeaceae archaeon]
MLSEPYHNRLSKRKKFNSLREVILDIIKNSKMPLTPPEIFNRSLTYFLPFEPSITSINNLLQKLARANIIEYVYLDLAYGVRFTKEAYHEHSIIN